MTDVPFYRASALEWSRKAKQGFTPELLDSLNDEIDAIYRAINSLATGNTSLSATGVTPGTYGDASHVSQVTVQADGRLTVAASVAITAGTGDIHSDGSVPFAANESMGSHKLTNVQDPTSAQDAATKNYVDSQAGLTLLEEHTAAGSATLDFTTAFTSTYDDYLIELIELIPASNNVDLRLIVSTNGGSTYDTGTNYARAIRLDNQAFNTVLGANSGDSNITFAPNVNSTETQASLSATIRLRDPLNASLYKQMHIVGGYKNNDGNRYAITGAGWYLSATAVNAIRFLFSTGNIASGTIRVYGLKK